MTNDPQQRLRSHLGRRISVVANGVLRVEDVPATRTYAIEVQAAEELLGAMDCRDFSYTTRDHDVALEPSQCLHLIDPIRWGEFSDIHTRNANKTTNKGPAGWSGTIEETVWVKLLGIEREYVNRLSIDYRVGTVGASVEFELVESLKGGLAYEKGSLRLEQRDGSLRLTIHKTLRYQPPSDWCRLPVWSLESILGVWLEGAADAYVEGMLAVSP